MTSMRKKITPLEKWALNKLKKFDEYLDKRLEKHGFQTFNVSIGTDALNQEGSKIGQRRRT
jgi:hypothetical protein